MQSSKKNKGSSSKKEAKKSVNFSEENEVFTVSSRNYTPALDDLKPAYRNPTERSVHCVAPPSSLHRPNHEDILKRVSVVIHQHIQTCENRLAMMVPETAETGLFYVSQMKKFDEALYLMPQYVYQFVRVPVARLGFLYGIHKLQASSCTPDYSNIHEFLRDLFIRAQLSAECSIVCLIYIERLMEVAHVPMVSKTWRPCLLCALLLASKVWQDLSSWNSEFAEIYPQFSLEAINKLEAIFCKEIEWNLNISSSVYAKYYFALRSLTEKKDFRRSYNAMVLNAPGAQQVEERSGEVKEEVFHNMTMSRSL
eukprot:gene3519-3855_t